MSERFVSEADLAGFTGIYLQKQGKAPTFLDMIDEFGAAWIIRHFGYVCRLMAIGMIRAPWQCKAVFA